MPPEELPAVRAQFWSADLVNHELVDYIRTLRPKYKVGLLSNAWNDLRQVMQERFDFDGLFDDLVISAEVGLAKPDPRIFHLAVERLGVQPAEARLRRRCARQRRSRPRGRAASHPLSE